MKKVLVVLMLLPLGGECLGQEAHREFLSWYNGRGVHTVWGAGKISGSYIGAHVKCGDTLVPVRAIHDSHESDGSPLHPTQTAEYASAHNVALLRSLESTGNRCAFVQAAPLRPNNSFKPKPLRGSA